MIGSIVGFLVCAVVVIIGERCVLRALAGSHWKRELQSGSYAAPLMLPTSSSVPPAPERASGHDNTAFLAACNFVQQTIRENEQTRDAIVQALKS